MADPTDLPQLRVLQPHGNPVSHFHDALSPSLLGALSGAPIGKLCLSMGQIPASLTLRTPASSLRCAPVPPSGLVMKARGMPPPRARSCPVPCDPPAGATGDATTCSRA